ncbi:MAG: MoaD/ThiS family protein [Deltaproteobacteria bacterium]|nr:MoaD/ThiS family protein [Deltaproteobacteria bacterium]
MSLFRRKASPGSPGSSAPGSEPRLRVHVLIRGTIGGRWYDVDETLAVVPGTTLAELVAQGAQHGVPLAEAVAESPHLRHTLMLNGERCPLAEQGARLLADGDELYLLAPMAGG